MLILPIVLLFFLEVRASQPTDVKAAELYFRLLQTDDKPTDDENTLRYPHRSRHNELHNRRPSPSDDLPIDDLIESQNVIYDPRPEDINIKLLRKQLGKNFDRDYMSIFNPNKRMKSDKKRGKNQIDNTSNDIIENDNAPVIDFIHGRPKGKRPHFLKRLRTARLQDGSKLKLNASKKERRKFQKYIWSLTFCPVKHSWKYLGIRFWPQWIREGSCTNKRSCSVPEGMMCKPSTPVKKTFLRWFCDDFKSRKSCRWIPVLYPIITECSCSC